MKKLKRGKTKRIEVEKMSSVIYDVILKRHNGSLSGVKNRIMRKGIKHEKDKNKN